MKDNPLISIISLTHGERKNDILSLLTNLQRQTYKNIEIYVSDNNSTDDSVDSIKTKFPAVQIVHLDKNIGTAGYNYSMEKAKGDYLILLDSDFEVENNLCRQVINIFDRNPSVDVIAFKSVSTITGKSVEIVPHSKKGNNEIGYEAFTFTGGAGAIRRKVYEKIERACWSKVLKPAFSRK